jgi:predicted acylesterase/phospholipase RssA
MRLEATVCIFLAALVAACSSTHPCPDCDPPADDYAARFACDAASVGFDTTPVRVLALSGGGALGAYGAGVFNGWREVDGEHEREPFHIVTGVSTGALQATPIFLGDDAALYKDYTNLPEQPMRRRPWWEILFGAPSIDRTDGLVHIIERQVAPPEAIAAVATHFGKRLLCVATTNLETGAFVEWDLTAVAHAAIEDGRSKFAEMSALYRKVLLASASVPVLSPSVDIQGFRHMDGGVRHQIFVVDFPRATRVLVYFLVNGQLAMPFECTPNTLAPILVRTIALLTKEGLIADLDQSLRQLDECCDVTAYFMSIADSYPLRMREDEFDSAKMCRLYCKGREDGSAAHWRTTPQALEPARQCDAAEIATETHRCADELHDETCLH